jgi:uncharacterized membrane protein
MLMLEEIIVNTNTGETILGMIELLAILIEVVVVLFIAYAVFSSVINFLLSKLKKEPEEALYQKFRHRLAHSLMNGLEMLIAADIIRTIALETSIDSILELGFLVFIRTFLSWSLSVEIEGRWPWQSKSETKK